MKNKHIITIAIFFFILQISSCTLFDSPKGKAEIVSMYESKSGLNHYLTLEIKINNISNKTIYQSTVSIEAKTTQRVFYKTINNSLLISPGRSIYTNCQLSFEELTSTENNEDTNIVEEWNRDSVTIIDEYYN